MAKGSAFADGKGSIDPDHYFDIIEDEGIIGSKENDVKDNEDGTYEVTTNEGYIFEITLVPTKENPEDIEIDYIGKGESTRPRISTIDVTGKTTNSISIAVGGKNLDGAEYTYYYKKSSEGEESWKEYSADKSSNTCTISGLETKVTYDIKVVVTTSKGTAQKQISEITGELAEGSITIENTEWQGDGTAKVTVTTDITEPGSYIEYKVGADGNSWTRIESGEEVTLQLNDEIYVRVTDGTNTLAEAYRKIEDSGKPIVTVTKIGEATSNSIAVNVQATDAESGMKENITYTYYIKESGEADTEYEVKTEGITNASYTFTELNQNTSYDIKVVVDGDKAGNTAEGTLENETTKQVGGATEGLKEGSIVATAPSWSNGQASIELTTDTGLQIQYQKGGIAGTWTTINSGEQVTGLNHNDTVYARLWDGRNAGAEASVEIQDTGKPNAPTINLSGTAGNNSYYKSNVTVTITAGSDSESGANKVRYSVSGVQTIAETTTADGTTSATITITTDGTSTITAYTLDKAGNVSDVKTQSVNKDKTAPSKANLTVGTVTETSIAVTAKGADATSGVYSYQFQRSTTSSTSGFTTVATKTSSNTSYSYTYTGLTAGTTYYLRVVVTDKAGNTKTGTAVTQATETAVLSADDIQKNPTAYYGAEVTGYTCASDGVSKWRLFYADENNIYIIADDYIAASDTPKGKNGSSITSISEYKLGFRNVVNDYTGASWISQNSKAKKWLNQYLSAYGSNTSINIKAVAYMMDTNVWSIYAGEKAEYAIGGPTLELFCASYQDTHTENYVQYTVASEYGFTPGYSMKMSGDSSEYSGGAIGVAVDDYNEIYIKSNKSRAAGMYLASPSATENDTIIDAYCSGSIYPCAYDGASMGLRPIICLKTDVKLKILDEGILIIEN